MAEKKKAPAPRARTPKAEAPTPQDGDRVMIGGLIGTVREVRDGTAHVDVENEAGDREADVSMGLAEMIWYEQEQYWYTPGLRDVGQHPITAGRV